MNTDKLEVIAKWISWVACALMSAVALTLSVLVLRRPEDMNIFLAIFVLIAALHVWAMWKTRYVLAFRLATVELGFLTLGFFGFIYPPIPGSTQPPMDVSLGSIGFWIWIVGGGVLATAAWVCGRAATNIKRKHSNATAN